MVTGKSSSRPLSVRATRVAAVHACTRNSDEDMTNQCGGEAASFKFADLQFN